MVAHVHPDCINASNPYHECTDYCFKKIADRQSTAGAPSKKEEASFADLPTQFGRKQELKKRPRPYDLPDPDEAPEADDPPPAAPVSIFARPVHEDPDDKQGAIRGAQGSALGRGQGAVDEAGGRREAGGEGGDGDVEGGAVEAAPSYDNLSGRQKKLFELRMKMNQARMANQSAVVAERKKEEKPKDGEKETRGMSKAKWYEEKKKKMSKVLDANGLDMSRAYMLDTQEAAEEKYKKWEKKEAAFGWDVFNQKSLYNAYKKRADNLVVDMDEYNELKEKDPDFYRDSTCLEYGKTPAIPEENVDRMVAELEDRRSKRKEFSRRRRYHEEKDVDSINERNEHFNRKIERAFGKYTVEIKNNLERGTALPD